MGEERREREEEGTGREGGREGREEEVGGRKRWEGEKREDEKGREVDGHKNTTLF